MEELDNIIVLKSFESAIEANLAKTKLDAYGIPCFLSEENIGNLYPIQNPRFSGVRLHLFQKDVEQARQVLRSTVALTEEDAVHCPRCGSARVGLAYSKKTNSKLLKQLAALLFMIIAPSKKVYNCPDCGLEFQAPTG
jgi:DNA-directed RNA polymerase subunit RPC12/RpoP